MFLRSGVLLSQGTVSCLFLGREGGAWFTVLRPVPICTSTTRTAVAAGVG